jgi:hypothetical protein
MSSSSFLNGRTSVRRTNVLINGPAAKALKARKTCKSNHDLESGCTVPYLVTITQMKTTKRDTKMKDSIATTMISVLIGRV